RYEVTADAEGYELVGQNPPGPVEIGKDRETVVDFVLKWKPSPPPTPPGPPGTTPTAKEQCIKGTVIAVEAGRQLLPPNTTQLTLFPLNVVGPPLAMKPDPQGRYQQAAAPGYYLVMVAAPGYAGYTTQPTLVVAGRCTTA